MHYVQTVRVLHLIGSITLVCHYFFMLALMYSFVVKMYGLTNMAGKPYSESTSYFFQTLDLIFLFIMVCALMGGSVAKISDLTNITVCNEKTDFCKARKTVCCQMRKTVICETNKTILQNEQNGFLQNKQNCNLANEKNLYSAKEAKL